MDLEIFVSLSYFEELYKSAVIIPSRRTGGVEVGYSSTHS